MIVVPDFHPNSIAPCGMNCGICLAHLREKNHCSGCLSEDMLQANHCSICKIRNCEKLKLTTSGYCYDCEEYPCKRIKHIDKRYRTKYGMSMIDNLDRIKLLGLEKYVELEKTRWACTNCGERLCVHRPQCQHCGEDRLIENFDNINK